MDTPEKRIIEWKFRTLDKDNDQKLRRTEVRSLKKMIKKLVKPKACAKAFDDYCDIDKDKKIVSSEWSICLGVDINSKCCFPFYKISQFACSIFRVNFAAWSETRNFAVAVS